MGFMKNILWLLNIMMCGDEINKTIIKCNWHAGGDMLETTKAGELKVSAMFRKFISCNQYSYFLFIFTFRVSDVCRSCIQK